MRKAGERPTWIQRGAAEKETLVSLMDILIAAEFKCEFCKAPVKSNCFNIFDNKVSCGCRERQEFSDKSAPGMAS